MRQTILILLAFLVLATGCGKKQTKARPELSTRVYPVKEMSRQSVILETEYPVVLKGEEDAEIKPRVSGYIDKVFVKEGDVVKRGTALFSINSPTSEQTLAAAKASLENAAANLNTARLNVERIRPLAEKNIVSEVQLRTYENAYKTALAAQEEAQATLTAAKATSGWTTVTSPIDGVVGSVPYRTGNMVTTGTTLTTIAKTDQVYAYFSMNEKALLALLNDLDGVTQEEKINSIPAVSLILPDGTVYSEKGNISAISGVVHTATGSVSLRASFPNPQGVLRSGLSGKIIIPRKMEDALTVPQKATFTQQDKVVIYRVMKDASGENDSTVQTIISVLPMPDGRNYVVTSGLSEGDRIVLDGVATLGDGRKIKTVAE